MSSNVGIVVSEGALVEPLIDVIERVKAGPQELSKNTSKDMAIILNHPELSQSALPRNLQCFKNYNGT
jgi:hypothetical protein